MLRALFIVLLLLWLPARAAPEDLAAFQQQAAETLEANDIPGAGIALIRDGEILWAGGIGFADIERGRHAVSSTRFRIGSITKMFTALAVLQLVEQGRLALDTPVRAIAPEVPIDNPWEDTDPVRVAHLLEHTAGFDDMHFRNMNTDATLPDSLAETVAALDEELAVRWRPGVMHAYSNPGYAVAGYLVEKIAGVPLHEFVDREIIASLGLEHTAWGNAETAMARGYDSDLQPVDARALRLYPAGDLSASSADLARLVQFFLARGAPLVTEASLTRMETPHTTRAARHGLLNGYGLGNYVSVRNGFRLHGHNGGLDGFVAALAYSPEHDFGYAIALNRADAAALRVLENQAVAFLTQHLPVPEAGALDTADARVPEGMQGCYRMMNSRNQLLRGLEWLVQVTCVKIEDGRALVRHPVIPQVTAMLPVGGALLREHGLAWPTAAYLHDGVAPDAIEWSGIYFERASRLAVTLPLVLAIIALALMLSSFVFFPIWAWRRWRGGLRDAPAISARAWPLVASALFMATLFTALQLELGLLDTPNAITLGIFFCGIAFVLASAYAVYLVIRTWRAGIHIVARWHSLLVALACAAVALYLIVWRLVPLRVWAW